MTSDRPTKTFGLIDATTLLRKLFYDVARLRRATVTEDAIFAAFDCAIDANHLVDWTVHALAKQARLEDRDGMSVRQFRKAHQKDWPSLEYCRQIADTGKHRILTRSYDDPALSTGTLVVFDPPFRADEPHTWSSTRIFPKAFIQIDGSRTEAGQFFHDVATE